ncbi:MAG: hypothetical protein ACD_7C00522G0003 [uncultured bacterium]|nr:MAG: hypothetical protein ACD_7C00522G0003 [uncultured bacterium]KKP68351.1 MAG: hypothetical protein UR66_C0006G0052 [Candidatus Moranbacteria bacterium GW2011_GWE1_35_17]KKP73162.1 MAG: hypothetical protein UR65_C0006G0006 [Candidatus Moranbacteria bacterium GW2011_GWE2_35_164]KKP84264.1 MAG: hypothetical protein UR82_C0009G0011 [Candidatus Moranbacteria bacterium GW2011_GWF1_35_5]KKP84923.1 MAG: hypothetical protein UR83_C0008G0037 [Candidatus Moranbacteria bacterium GW2011_GWF2_35_54]
MEPSEKYIKEFQEIYKKEHGEDLSWEEIIINNGLGRLHLVTVIKNRNRKNKKIN